MFVFFKHHDLSQLASSFDEADTVPFKLMLVQDAALFIFLINVLFQRSAQSFVTFLDHILKH